MRNLKKYISISLTLVIFFLLSTWNENVCYAEDDYEYIPVVVSLGDSYSSGEGCPDFYGQKDSDGKELSRKEKVNNLDWLAHRSENAWAGFLEFNDHKLNEFKDERWFFYATSGAKTYNVTGNEVAAQKDTENKNIKSDGTKGAEQLIKYTHPDHLLLQEKLMPIQLTETSNMRVNKNLKIDYVTLTIGGNDVGFVNIITSAACSVNYLVPNKLNKALEKAWEIFGDGTLLEDTYRDIYEKTGYAYIIVAGYPQLIDRSGGGPFSKEEAVLIDDNVKKFNEKIEEIIGKLRDEGMKIKFVPIDFKDHLAYSGEDYSYIEKIKLHQEQDIASNKWISAYSMHPNKKGQKEYAEAVQKAIDEIEKERKKIDYKTAYYEVIQKKSMEISDYKWQYGVEYDGSFMYPKKENTSIAITDITGDDIPELIIMFATDYHGVGKLEIYTFDEYSTAKLIYANENWDVLAAGGTGYFLFKTYGDDRLYAYHGTYDEWTTDEYNVFKINDAGMLEIEKIMDCYSEPSLDYSNITEIFTINGIEVSKTDYKEKEKELLSNISQNIMFNYGATVFGDELMKEKIGNADVIYLTYGQAKRLLAVDTPQKDNILPVGQDGQWLSFSSGVGAWSTEIHIMPDGSFEGYFHDTNSGASGDGYSCEIYECQFNGKFKNIKIADADTYVMELDYLNSDYEEGKEWIENGCKHISSYAYGIEGGKVFELYLPGTLVNKLSDEYVSWVYGLSRLTTLRGYGIYNIEMQEGFSQWD